MTADEFFTPSPLPAQRRVPFEQLLANYGPVFPVTNVSASVINQANARGPRVRTDPGIFAHTPEEAA